MPYRGRSGCHSRYGFFMLFCERVRISLTLESALYSNDLSVPATVFKSDYEFSLSKRIRVVQRDAHLGFSM